LHTLKTPGSVCLKVSLWGIHRDVRLLDCLGK
jgi:hypothetical protein